MGVVQGLTEFLPVSSSGHLLLLEKITGMSESDGGAFFTTMVHIATLVAVVIVYIEASLSKDLALYHHSDGAYRYHSAFI